MEMKLRLATYLDLPSLAKLYGKARQYMASHGNSKQWGNNEPSLSWLSGQIDKSFLYVLAEEDGTVHGAFTLQKGEEKTYQSIDGKWLSAKPYITIHKLASDGKVPHFFSNYVLPFALKASSHLRVDTSLQNEIMNALLKENGFTYCGIIKVKGNSLRNAYERI